MKKTVLTLLALALVLSLAPSAWAQADTHFWFDIRNNTGTATGAKVLYLNQDITSGTPIFRPFTDGQGGLFGAAAFNSGREGDGQVLRISASHSDGWHAIPRGLHGYPDFDNDDNFATGDLWLYAYVNSKIDANDVISSIGLDFDTVPEFGDGSQNQIGSMSLTWEGYWTDTNAGTASGSWVAPNYVGAKAVKVPVAGDPPAFNTTNALVPSADPYRLAKLTVTGGTRECSSLKNHASKSTYGVRMGVNELLITRVNTTDPGDETVAFGYTAGVEDTQTYNGSLDTEDYTIHAADAYIQLRMKWDGSNDGQVNNSDIAGWSAAKNQATPLTQEQMYLYDWGQDRLVNNSDLPGLGDGKTATACP